MLQESFEIKKKAAETNRFRRDRETWEKIFKEEI